MNAKQVCGLSQIPGVHLKKQKQIPYTITAGTPS